MSGKSLEETAMDVDVYAKDFVANALSAVPSTRYWSGSSSSQVWAIQRFFGSVIWVCFPVDYHDLLDFGS